ncbi:MAG TPA: hypothetical protein VLH13_01285 [Methanomassiliicoccales archaeon]|nr:hypothetical protein [Methanomassiliicoccales archaeon]
MTENFGQKEHQVGYLGSRDIDLGFVIDPNCDIEELRKCTMAKAISLLEGEGYIRHSSFRFCKFIHKDTGRILTEQESKSIPQYDLFYLYVDMMVDRIHPKHKEIFGIDQLDEPVIEMALKQGRTVQVELDGAQIVIPEPELLLTSKLKSLPGRQDGDKVWKDACDIYAILWYSNKPFNSLVKYARINCAENITLTIRRINDDIANRAAKHLGIEVETFLRVLARLERN